MRSRHHAKPLGDLIEAPVECAEAAEVAFAEQLEFAGTETLRDAVRCRQARGVVSWMRNQCQCLDCQAELVHHLAVSRQRPQGLLRYA